jgi:branched-chain amino acid aminotransferase
MHPHVLYNNRIHRADEKILQPGQIGLLSGWGIFTTLRIYEGIPFAFERHWRRLQRDAKLLHIDLWQKYEDVRQNLLRLIEANAATEATMRVCAFRSQGGFWEGPGSGNSTDLVAFTTNLNAWRDSVALSVVEHGRHAASPFAGTKTLSWAYNMTIFETAQQGGFSDAILLNERGEVAECTSANIFIVQRGVTYTPPLTSGSLPGVTRAVMLEELEVDGSPVVEQVLRLNDVYEAEEVFITSTTRELLPVHQIQERPLSSTPGHPIMEKLRSGLREYVRNYVAEARHSAPVKA